MVPRHSHEYRAAAGRIQGDPHVGEVKQKGSHELAKHSIRFCAGIVGAGIVCAGIVGNSQNRFLAVAVAEEGVK